MKKRTFYSLNGPDGRWGEDGSIARDALPTFLSVCRPCWKTCLVARKRADVLVMAGLFRRSAWVILLGAASYYAHRYAEARRKVDLIFHGRLRLLNAVLVAVLDRLFVLPFRRLVRYASLLSGWGVPMPNYVTDLQDSCGQQFLTTLLRERKRLPPSASVAGVTIKPFTSGQMSDAARISIIFSGQVDASLDPPATLIVKMTRQDIQGKAINMLMGLYRECECYRSFLTQLDLPVPECLYAAVDEFSKDFLLVLEDGSYAGPMLGYVPSTTVGAMCVQDGIGTDSLKAMGVPAIYYDQVPPSDRYSVSVNVDNVDRAVDLVKQATVALSRMHRKYWMDSSLFDQDLHLVDRDSVAEAYAAAVASWEATKTKARSGKYEGTTPWRGCTDIPAFEQSVLDCLMLPIYQWSLDRFGDKEAWLQLDDETWQEDLVADAGYTLLHGDFHAENVFVRNLPSGSDLSPFLLLDWQVVSVGDPVKDIAKMCLFGGLDNYGRVQHEEEILRAWWEAFTDDKEGVSKEVYPWALCWSGYRYWLSHHAATLVILCEVAKFFVEDNAAGYRMAVDKFNSVLKSHGDPVHIYEERRKVIASLPHNAILHQHSVVRTPIKGQQR